MLKGFISFEGVEGSGKSTQVADLHRWMDSLRAGVGVESWAYVLSTKEPGGTALGAAIRRLLLEEEDLSVHKRAELMLYGADRAQHVEEVIKPHLARGGLVLCDRYTDSTIAYQCYGRGLDRLLIEAVNFLATGDLEPNLTIWLDLDPKIGLKRVGDRGKLDRIEKTELAFHQRVQRGYAELAAAFPRRIVRVDANRPRWEVQQDVRKIVLSRP
jgi:dTMP kinase